MTNVDESGISYAKRTAGPSGCTTSAMNGISTGLPDGTGTFHSLPSHVVMIDFESGVNAMPGNTSSDADDS